MRILYYECFAGISGDMNLGAMLALGLDEKILRRELAKLDIDEEFELRVADDARKGICGTRVDVIQTGHTQAQKEKEHHHGLHHDHDHPHAEACHCHHEHHAENPDNHSHHPTEGGHHPSHHHGRNLPDIERIINASDLSDEVKYTSLAIFRRLARAEAAVHGKPIDEVHFHEVGATDCLVDIVGAAICRSLLEVDEIWASPVELGGGFVECAHGRIPVPAPATVNILEGIPTTRGAVRKEMTTPTGAAILAEFVDRFTASPELIMKKTAYGIGQRDTEIPNVLRVTLARPLTFQNGASVSTARMLQCNIDDMTAEMMGVAMERLMDAGAMDVHFTPIQMKKNRPATSLSLLCAQRDEARFKELLFLHTTTLGIKSFRLEKTALKTRFRTLQTPLGSVRMKQALLNDKVLREKPELEDCRSIAEKNDIPLAAVYAMIADTDKK